jgi:hypothetical protein
VAIALTWLEQAGEEWVPVASLLGVMAVGFIILQKSEPAGAIDIMIMGERILNKRLGTVWKVIGEREMWVKDGQRQAKTDIFGKPDETEPQNGK